MLPLIPPGSLALVEPSVSTPRVGDVVLRLSGDTPLVHRVVRRTRFPDSQRLFFRTKGDRSVRFDPPVGGEGIIGVVHCVYVRMEDGQLWLRVLPRFSGLWIACLSRLLGGLGRIIACQTGGETDAIPRKTVAWLLLTLARGAVKEGIDLVARGFKPCRSLSSRHVASDTDPLVAKTFHCGRTTSR